MIAHGSQSPVRPEPPLLIDASECDGCIWPTTGVTLPLTNSRCSLRRCRRRRNRLRRNEPEFRTPAILLKSAASDPVVDTSVTSQVLRWRLPSSSTLHRHKNITQHNTQPPELVFITACNHYFSKSLTLHQVSLAFHQINSTSLNALHFTTRKKSNFLNTGANNYKSKIHLQTKVAIKIICYYKRCTAKRLHAWLC